MATTTWVYSDSSEKGLWKDYRLGDMVSLKVSRQKPDGEKLHAQMFPTSIASEYMRRTKYEDQFTILADIVRNWSPVAAVGDGGAATEHIDWAIHIRGGDVLEDKVSIESTQHAESGCDVSVKNLLKENTWYVRSIDNIMKDFTPKSTDKELTVCILTGGCHVIKAPKTKTYVAIIAHKFASHPKVKRVIIRFFNSPDEDFVIMCRAPHFIQSAGQYTYIITNTRKIQNVIQNEY